MDELQKQMAAMSNSSKSKVDSFMTVLGSDTDSSFDKPIVIDIVQDTYHISAGGQQVQPNANIQVQIDDQDCAHYLKKYGIAFELDTYNGYFENSLAAFDGLEMQIGSQTWSTAFQKYYAQYKLARMGKYAIEMVANGLALKHDNFAVIPAASGDSFPGTGASTNVSADAMQLYTRQLQVHDTYRYEGITQKCFVPLSLIFPSINELSDDGCVPLQLGQKIKFNIKTVPASECMVSTGSDPTLLTYILRNVSLVRVYSKLDPIRSDLILKSVVSMPKLSYIHWQQNQLTNVVNAIYGVSAKDRIRSLVFGFSSNVQATVGSDAANIEANLINGVACSYKYPLGYHCQLPIQQIQVQVNGHVYNINMTQLQMLHLSPLLSDQKETYSWPVQRQLKYAYVLDLTRFGINEDLFGSSSKSVGTVTIQITLLTGTRTLIGQTADWDATAFSRFGFYSYLEVQQMIECKNGIYVAA